MRIVITIISALAIGAIAWFFLLSSYFLPKNYSDCLKTRTNDYTRNDLVCTYSPSTPAQQRFCITKDGIINQLKQCLIVYYNPSFVFPKSIDECIQKIGSTNGQVCDLDVNRRGAYDGELAQKLVDECIKNSGQDKAKSFGATGCSIRFQQ